MDELTGELGTGFSVDVCKKWEKTFNEVTLPNTRKVLLRIAIVLSNNGGAFLPLRNLVKRGFGGKQGTGKQYVSWLHETDFTNIIDFVINNFRISGVYNAAAPNPIPNHEFMHLLRKAYNIPFGFPLHK
jgi:NAD dependent epimerase/dehydratase family enzyme